MTDPMQTEREAFEAFATREGWTLERMSVRPNSTYSQYETYIAWGAWRAATAKQDSELRSLRDALALAKSRIAELEGRADDTEERLLCIALYGDRGNSAKLRMQIRAALKENSE